MRQQDLHSQPVPLQPQPQQQEIGSANSQRDRLLQQMRKCVLVHHQLSCLLIEGAAQQAGICSNDLDTNGLNLGDLSLESCEDLKLSLGGLGPAAQLAVAAQEGQDFTAAGESLQDRVDNIMDKIEGEIEVAKSRAGGPSRPASGEEPARAG